MKVLKFGGTSVGSPSRMKGVAQLVINTGGKKVVVLSAVSGTTNALVEISEYHQKADLDGTLQKTRELRAKYDPFIEELLDSAALRQKATEIVDQYFAEMERLIRQPFREQIAKLTVVFGELISTNLFALYLQQIDYPQQLIAAVDFMYLNDSGDPDTPVIESRLQAVLANYETTATFITQGFICRNADGGTDNLKRGGSDYSATLIGAAIKAEEVQIWTDIDGMHNNDPRVVDKTHPISRLSFDEAGELAYFGAKILHPTCIIPAQQHDVPVRI